MKRYKMSDYCLGIYNSTPASWKRRFKYCPMCGVKLDFDIIIPVDREKRKNDGGLKGEM